MSQVSLDLDLDDAGSPTYTVGELGEAISAALRRQFDEGVWVRGEIDRITSDKNGNAYFDLLDDTDGVKAKISVVCFRVVRERLRHMLSRYGLQLMSGMKVRVHGQLDYYAPGGRLSLRIDAIDPQFTVGEIALARQALVTAMRADGSYDAQRRLTMPPTPRVIGVVTSIGTAAWHDFAHQLQQSALGFELRVCDVRVQGEWAVEMVTSAIRTLSAAADVESIVVIRGGGARSELAVFDSEPIVRAIAEAPVPVLTGLGHQTDQSVADEVAHLAHKTPTACAEWLIGRVREFRSRTEGLWTRIDTLAVDALDNRAARLDQTRLRIADRTRSALVRADERLARAARAVPVAARSSVGAQRAATERSADRLRREARRQLAVAALTIDGAAATARLLDPVNTLARGYSITRDRHGNTVRSPVDVADGDVLHTTLADGVISSVANRPGV